MFVKVNNNDYWTEQAGKGSPLLLLHGFTGTSHTWDACKEEWAKHFHVLSIDLPGHGKTEVHTPYTMESVCRDIASILTALGLDKAHVLGYSMGGRTALSFACLYPNLVSTLILESSSPGLKVKKEREERVKHDTKLADFLEKEGIRAFVEYWESIPLFQTQKNLATEKQEQIRMERLSHTDKGLADSLRYMGTGMQPSWWHHLHNLQVPILLIVGEYDQKFMNLNQQMLKKFNNAKLCIVEKTGHAVHVEESQKFGKIVSDFILNEEKHKC
ncbi:2-succinyl-6-hydroxy-2,4-cyclohexadiene-1-carboxylate synthase [Salirhabdus sp. Marseille-P4669]|uniref:2-succinyl-6-hydroxy-2, 4-cyclohexadiene-1-carboxylate synthase n=1 Tax=Salirhabdus sp. Marseille-P4669 TaxID=2042310 RepID=UPI000C7B7C60|nr:2-succinyl-6-hydroxy-2,4-cyclohexadiene-1-carboxylate synthase [Salirhabdus sp. Marseille-P4669]